MFSEIASMTVYGNSAAATMRRPLPEVTVTGTMVTSMIRKRPSSSTAPITVSLQVTRPRLSPPRRHYFGATRSVKPEAHYWERAIPILSLYHGIFTDRSIVTLLFPLKRSVPIYKIAHR